MALWLGIDIGATNVKTALVEDLDWTIADTATEPTDLRSPQHTIEGCAQIARGWVRRVPRLSGVGITLPGLFEPASGEALVIPNIPGDWRRQPVREPIATAAARPTALLNDARAFVLAESRLGAARAFEDVIGVVLGTGIGGGVVLGGRLLAGHLGHAGEIGHQVLKRDGPLCGCGNRGCLEALARAEVVAAAAGRATVAEAVEAAAGGDARASGALEDAGRWIGLGLANVLTVLTPQAVVIGGGVAQAGHVLLGPLCDQLRASSPLVPSGSYVVRCAELGPYAGAVGAAAAAADGGVTSRNDLIP